MGISLFYQFNKDASTSLTVIKKVNPLINICLTYKVVEAICDHPGIKAVSFVGSTPIAKLVSTRAQATHKRVVALGGAKNHLVAAPDCNINVTARDIVNSFSGCAGERCMAASVLLMIGEQSTLLEKIVELSKEIKPGNKSGEMGPVIDKAALEKIERYLTEAEKSNAEILVDGRTWKGMEGTDPNGFWIGPTVILHRNKDDPAMKVLDLRWETNINRRKSLVRCYRFWKSVQKRKPSPSKILPHSAMQPPFTLLQD
jgi:acyl-CoA reductase-like NAD-dependent aldehyde dehydrogenase